MEVWLSCIYPFFYWPYISTVGRWITNIQHPSEITKLQPLTLCFWENMQAFWWSAVVFFFFKMNLFFNKILLEYKKLLSLWLQIRLFANVKSTADDTSKYQSGFSYFSPCLFSHMPVILLVWYANIWYMFSPCNSNCFDKKNFQGVCYSWVIIDGPALIRKSGLILNFIIYP